MSVLKVFTKESTDYFTGYSANIREDFNVKSIDSFVIIDGWLTVCTSSNTVVSIKESDVVRLEFIP